MQITRVLLCLVLLGVMVTADWGGGRGGEGVVYADDPVRPSVRPFVPGAPAPAAGPAQPAPAAPGVTVREVGVRARPAPAPRGARNLFGMSVDEGKPDEYGWRFGKAQAAGATWNRLALYWNFVERTKDSFDFTEYDKQISVNLEHGLPIMGILLGTPIWASTKPVSASPGTPAPASPAPVTPPPLYPHLQPRPRFGAVPPPEAPIVADGIAETIYTPKNLYAPIFVDAGGGGGSDEPAPGRVINPDNYWARFVFKMVEHYRGHVKVWEIWNEPDYAPTEATGFFGFWNGGVRDYARLLKVAYAATKAADPEAIVVLGGLAYHFQPSFLDELMQVLVADPGASRHHHYFDVVNYHWYSRARAIYEQTERVNRLFDRLRVARKPMWITEWGVPVCGDPGVAFQPACRPGNHRGDLADQASLVWQGLAYALAAGVEMMAYFQLFDGDIGPYEYYGLVRNDTTNRPSYDAFVTASRTLRDVTHARLVELHGGQVDLVYGYLAGGGRVTLAWSYATSPTTLELPAESAKATLVHPLGGPSGEVAASPDRRFRVTLPATLGNHAAPGVIVGGTPLILVEREGSPAPGRLVGRLADQHGNGFAGIVVAAGGRTARTDARGVYSLELPSGPYDLTIGAIRGEPGRRIATAVWGGKETRHDVTVKVPYVLALPAVAHEPRAVAGLAAQRDEVGRVTYRVPRRLRPLLSGEW
ncbi:MAG: hypothetical protein HY329_13075 [Chloroflexi bacterium]|nr:hypothetical protein [Chloroflexota bacterium]